MAKEKVYKLAQEFKVSSEALMQMLKGMGILVKSHMSTVDETLRDEIKKRFDSERAEIKKEYERKKQIITKAKEDLLSHVEPPPAAPVPAAAATPPITQAPTVEPLAQPRAPQSTPAVSRPAAIRPQQPSHGPAARSTPNQQNRSFTPNRGYSPSHASSAPRPVGAGPRASVPHSVAIELPLAPQTDSSQKDKKKGSDRKKKVDRPEVNETQMRANVKKTLAKIGSGSAKKKYKKEDSQSGDENESEKKILNVSEFVTAAELANMIGKSATEVIAKCLELGLFVTINKRLDFDTIEVVADEFGYIAKLMDEYLADELLETKEETSAENRVPRPPVVTVMGHVDHGKTSLLDYIRKTNVIAGEAGGITQHIAAYKVETKHGPVTFLDTPGHEAFTAMRARGSQITDVIVLVVAADSGVMPQTKEAIDHARAAEVPIVVAINKTDLPHANPDKVKAELSAYNVVVEDWGGPTSCVEISARTGKGIDKLLELLALETEMLELKEVDKGKAQGVIVEAELDKGKGSIATVLVQKGILQKGDAFVTGIHFGRVRDLLNVRGVSVETAGPSDPVVVLGLSGTPQAGDSFRVLDDEKEAREISARRRLAQREREQRRIGAVSLDHLYEHIKAGNVQNINLVIKGDVDGSVEALADSLIKLSMGEIKVNVIRKSVGAVTESDILLAAASNAIIVGFHLSPNSKIRELAKREGVDIRTYRIIYEAVDAVKNAMEGMLKPEIRENQLGEAEIRQVFRISGIGVVAGCFVSSGTITRNAKARLIRNDVEIVDSSISTLRHFKDEAREVQSGTECGLSLEKFSDYKEGDRVVVYEEIKVARKLK